MGCVLKSQARYLSFLFNQNPHFFPASKLFCQSLF
jgi:hypothetical protein